MDDPDENLTTSSETHRTTNGTGRRNMKNTKGQIDNNKPHKHIGRKRTQTLGIHKTDKRNETKEQNEQTKGTQNNTIETNET